MSIKYYHLAKDETPPEEFCAIRDVGGEPGEYMFYVPEAENDKLRELVRGLHMAYIGALNKCESMDAGLIWDHCEMVDAELAKSHARFEADRHRFDVAMSELGVEVDG